MQDVGDQMHYLLICACFQNDREKYIKKNTFTRDQIFSSSDNLCLQISYLFKASMSFHSNFITKRKVTFTKIEFYLMH